MAATNDDGNQLTQIKQDPRASGLGATIAGKLTGPLGIVLAVVAVDGLAHWLNPTLGNRMP